MTNRSLSSLLRVLADTAPPQPSANSEDLLLLQFRNRKRRKTASRIGWALAAVVALVGLSYPLLRHSHAQSPLPLADEHDRQSEFVALPYAQSGVPLEQPVIVRVNIPASQLLSVGLPVTGMRENVEADLLVGQDGVPRAVRIVQ